MYIYDEGESAVPLFENNDPDYKHRKELREQSVAIYLGWA